MFNEILLMSKCKKGRSAKYKYLVKEQIRAFIARLKIFHQIKWIKA